MLQGIEVMMEEYAPYVFRPAQLSDLDAIYAFSKVAGLTNLPPHRDMLEDNIRRSLHCFSSAAHLPLPTDFYFFVLENTHTHTPVGCSGIFADITPPFYTFHWDKVNHCLALSKRISDISEMAALYLDPKHRLHHMGAFLSRARYLWMASHPTRFHDTVFAEMRGRIDKHEQSPFWELFVHHYIKDKSLKQADFDLARHQIEFIDTLLPHMPIAIDTLDKRVQACIGAPHINTRAAVNLLLREGFTYIDHVNIFDGGPILKARTDDIHTIKNSFTCTYAGERASPTGGLHFIATTQGAFCVTLSRIDIDTGNQYCYFPLATAERLQLNLHDTVRLCEF